MSFLQPIRIFPRLLLFAFLWVLGGGAWAQNAMTLSHSDLSRDGWNPNETLLAPSNIATPGNFGKLFNHLVDGHVYAQPLYVPNLNIGGTTHNVIFVCTMHDSVYAFDADTSQAPLWHDSFLGTFGSVTVTTIPNREIASCPDTPPEYGVLSTPAIDLSTNTLYCVAATKEVSPGPVTNYAHRLHALSLVDGSEKFGGPATITAVWNGTGGPITFNDALEINRPGLVLTNGSVYSFWSSHCDDGAYYGWILGYNASNLSPQSVFNVSPVTQRGGIWQNGSAPAMDANGNFYMTTGTGAFNLNAGGVDHGESMIKFTGGGSPMITDYFTPSNWAALDSMDNEMGSTGAVLLPDSFGTATHPHVLTCGDKAGDVFLLDRDNLGGFDQGPGGTDAVIQKFNPAPMAFSSFMTPAVYNNTVYWNFVDTPIEAFSFANGQYTTTPSSQTSLVYHFPGCNPSISSNGNTNGILWAIEPDPVNAGLHAYDATDLTKELYNSNHVTGDVINSPNNKFTPPTIINGKVYVATANSLEVFGLLITATPFPTPFPSSTPTLTATSTFTRTSTNTPTNSATPSVTNTVTVTPSLTASQTVPPTATNTPAATSTSTLTPTLSASPSPTVSPSFTPTDSSTVTADFTPSFTPTFTSTLTLSFTATMTPINTVTQTSTSTAINSATSTATNTATNTSTNTRTITATNTGTNTATSTTTSTATNTGTDTVTNTVTNTMTNTTTKTGTNTATMTVSPTPVLTSTAISTTTLSSTSTPTDSVTPSPTDLWTSTPTSTSTRTPQTTATPTPSPTLTRTLTPTVSNTSTAILTPSPVTSPANPQGDFFPLVVVAPNISRDGQPIKFRFNLRKGVQIWISIYNVTGELIYYGSIGGYAGSNDLVWPLKNQSGEDPASGIYFYVLQVDGEDAKKIGKILVLH